MSYQHREVKAPRIVGWALRSLAALAENPLSAGMVRQQMLRQLGFEEWRRLPIDDTPLPMALHPRSSDETPAADLDLQALVDQSLPAAPFVTVAEYRQAYLQGHSNPRRVVDKLCAAVDASEHMDRPLRVFIHFDREDLISQAEASAARYAKGQSLGPLDGVPVAVKDELDVAGMPTTVGTGFLGKTPAQQDATVVARLRAAGALIIGKTNMHEIGIGVTGINPNHGSARNPYHLDHVTGGSSSGSAAAVAAGFCPIAVGADGGGSVRIPAAFCGQFGLKSTFGRVSEHGAAPLAWSVAHIGPIASSVDDLALAYAVMAGPDEADPLSRHQSPVSLQALHQTELTGLKIGVFDLWFDDASEAVRQHCRAALEQAQALGAQIVPIQLEALQESHLAHLITIVAEMSASQQQYLQQGARHGTDVRLNLALAQGLSATDYVQAQRWRQRAVAIWNEQLEQVDLIASPMTGLTAPKLHPEALSDGESDLTILNEIMRFATIGNLTGLPALTLPVGVDDGGLPVGLQLIAGAWKEALLLRVARALAPQFKRPMPAWHVQLLS